MTSHHLDEKMSQRNKVSNGFDFCHLKGTNLFRERLRKRFDRKHSENWLYGHHQLGYYSMMNMYFKMTSEAKRSEFSLRDIIDH